MIRYREVKSWRGLVSRAKFRMDDLYLEAFLWQSQDALQENVITDNEYLIACYLPFPNRNWHKGIIGELDFCQDELGFSTVAHELVHLIKDVDSNLQIDEEKLADWIGEIAERLVVEFISEPLDTDE